MKKTKTKIIGFQSGHDVSYCILENGIPTLYNEWERFLRKKEPEGDGLKLFFDHRENTEDTRNIEYFTHGNPGFREGYFATRNVPEHGKFPCFNQEYDDKMKKTGAEYLEFSHHKCHAAHAFFSSNHQKSLIITLDGGGKELEYGATAATVWSGEGNKINNLHTYPLSELNIGSLWSTVTEDVFGLSWGYPYGRSAGTVMAMATVGDPDTEDYLQIFNGCFSYPGITEEAKDYLKGIVNRSEQDSYNVAAALQKATELQVKEFVELWTQKFPTYKNLCLAGGVALNSVIIGKIYDWFPHLESVFVPPVPYDGGLSIGSAQYLWHHVLDNPRIEWEDNYTPYLGRTYSKEEVFSAIQKFGLDFEYVTDDDVVDLLSKDDNVVSVFGGSSESGRRALGNRSILGDPRSLTMKSVINEKVKHRQHFRPFAPSILREEVKNWFVKDVDSPYMTAVIKFKEEVRDKVPAVCHFDYSGRLQTVTRKGNEWYYNFIKKFGEKTGVPILLNTSFNDREPIVESPQDGIACFLKTDIDYLYFFDVGVLIKKNA
tara:strand:- start:1446 stop:3077 length:1632 start_codon:yes stop_codon:yes gene_type:complete